jgi:tripartite-type tricarboxylate transporter receptor subunit TctC
VHARSVAIGIIALVAAASLMTQTRADDYPSNKIRIVVPTAAGGVADSLARIVAAQIQDPIGQPVFVEDRPGANGNVGAAAVLAAPADAYTIMMGHIGLMTINYHLYQKMEFEPIKAFVPIVHVVSYPDVLLVSNDLPVSTFADFVKFAKANPSASTYSSSGFGSSFHMAMELLKSRAGIEAVHVPYAGTAAALNALLSGAVNVTFTDTMAASPHIAAKKVRALAVTGDHRFKSLPDIPTVIESGIPGFVVEGWSGLVAKVGTPLERTKLLNEHVNRALRLPDVVQKVSQLGAEVVGGTAEQFGEFMAAEDTKWGELARKARLQLPAQ